MNNVVDMLVVQGPAKEVLRSEDGISVIEKDVSLVAIPYYARSNRGPTAMVVWMNYYGRKHQGAIRGMAMAVMIFAAAAGPLPLALSIDWLESYNPALFGFVAAPLISAALVWTARPPRISPV